MILHKDSHTDLIPKDVLDFAFMYFRGYTEPFIETVELPTRFGTVECGLYGPAMGDLSIWEMHVWYAKRPGRSWESRLINKPTRQTRRLTVVAGPYDGHPCVLYTVYSGPAAPKEPGDPTIKSEAERMGPEAFWAHHALSGVGL